MFFPAWQRVRAIQLPIITVRYNGGGGSGQPWPRCWAEAQLFASPKHRSTRSVHHPNMRRLDDRSVARLNRGPMQGNLRCRVAMQACRADPNDQAASVQLLQDAMRRACNNVLPEVLLFGRQPIGRRAQSVRRDRLASTQGALGFTTFRWKSVKPVQGGGFGFATYHARSYHVFDPL